MNHNWEYKRLGDICDKGSSNLMQKNLELTDEGYDVYGASGCLGRIDFYQQSEPYVGIVKDGSGVGRCKLYPAKTSLLSTMQYILGKPSVNIAYLCYLLQSLNLAKYVNGATIPHIYFRDYQNEIVPVPPLAVQEQIVAELDALNATLDKCRQLLATLDSLAQSLFYDTFGDPITNPKGWEMKPFGQICKLSAGGDKPEDTEKHKSSEKQIPVYSNGIDNEGLYGFSSTAKVYEPSLTISGRGTLGVAFIRRTPFVPIIRLIVATPIENVNLIYLFYLVNLLKLGGKGATIPQLTVPMIKDRLIPVPPLALQEEFAGKIEAIGAEKKRVGATMAEVQTLLDSRMDYWFN